MGVASVETTSGNRAAIETTCKAGETGLPFHLYFRWKRRDDFRLYVSTTLREKAITNTIFADYLNIMYIPNSGELIIFAGAFVGACVGFLWYNSYPAQVFMGDTGSLALGGIIAALAIIVRKELLIPFFCFVFFVFPQ